MASRRVLTDDLKNVEFETSEEVDVTPTFDSMGLREDLIRGIYAYGNTKSSWMCAWCTRTVPVVRVEDPGQGLETGSSSVGGRFTIRTNIDYPIHLSHKTGHFDFFYKIPKYSTTTSNHFIPNVWTHLINFHY